MISIPEAISRAVKFHQAGHLQQAEQLYRQILDADPRHSDALHLLGVIAYQTGRRDAGIASIREALRVNPDLAEAHCNLGFFLQEQGKLDEAGASLQEALRLKPNYVEAHYNMGIVRAEEGKLEEAVGFFQRAVRVKPDYADAHNNLGNALKDQGNVAEAIASYREALRLRPGYAMAHNNLGVVLMEQRQLDEAEACYRQALRLEPGLADTHTNLGFLWLLQGDFAKGWDAYEWRWRSKILSKYLLRTSKPVWDGSRLDGRTIYLYAEQGLGDTLQFVRFAALVKARGGRVIVGCQAPLVRLLQGCAGIDQVVASSPDLPPFDVHAALMSLPRIFGTTVGTVPAAIPYLTADPQRTDEWRAKLGGGPTLKIGIVWQGDPRQSFAFLRAADRRRSFPLAHFEPLARLANVRLISLQKGFGTEQLAQVADRFAVANLGDVLHDFTDTAAIMKNMDLVISADTSPAHLAGALGVPVWVPVPFQSCWRWLLQREDSPWYPTMRLFRQKEAGDWDEVFRRMARELEKS